jgi:hypothetical protein
MPLMKPIASFSPAAQDEISSGFETIITGAEGAMSYR